MQIILFISSLLVFVQVMKIQSFMLHDNKKSAINADCLLQKKARFYRFLATIFTLLQAYRLFEHCNGKPNGF